MAIMSRVESRHRRSLDGPRARLTSFPARPRLGLAEEGPQLVDELPRIGARPIERLDPREPLEHRLRFVHAPTVAPSRSWPGNGFEPK